MLDQECQKHEVCRRVRRRAQWAMPTARGVQESPPKAPGQQGAAVELMAWSNNTPMPYGGAASGQAGVFGMGMGDTYAVGGAGSVGGIGGAGTGVGGAPGGMWPLMGGMNMGMGVGGAPLAVRTGGVVGGDGGMWPAMGGMHMGMGWGAGSGMGASSGLGAQHGSTPDAPYAHGLQESLRMDVQENHRAYTKHKHNKRKRRCEHNRHPAYCKDCCGSQM